MTDKPAPLNLSELKTRLVYGDLSERLAAMQELSEYGAEAAPVMPTLAEQCRLGNISGPSWLLSRLYAATRSPELLGAFRATSAWDNWGVWEKCEMLRAGVLEFEPEVRHFLANHWRQPGEPRRVEAVEALREAGSNDALELLQVIEYQMAEDVRTRELELKRHGMGDKLAEVSLAANVQFLEKVKSAIKHLSQLKEAFRGGL